VVTRREGKIIRPSCSEFVTRTASAKSLPIAYGILRVGRSGSGGAVRRIPVATLTIWPGRMPFLKDFSYQIAAVCSTCGDTLLARLRHDNDDGKGAVRLQARLQEVFQRHLAEKHQVKNELNRTA